jgi:recombination protein RecA
MGSKRGGWSFGRQEPSLLTNNPAKSRIYIGEQKAKLKLSRLRASGPAFPEILEDSMSTVVVSTSAALGRPFLFDDDPASHVVTAAIGCPVERSSTAYQQHLLSTINGRKLPSASITPASRLEIRPAPEMVSSGIAALDALTGGLPRGCLTELCGPASSGRTSVMLAALAAATRRGEYCALIDASDTLDPQSIAAAGVDLDRLLWVRCGDDVSFKSSPQKSGGKQDGCPISRAPSAREACPEHVGRVGISSQTAFEFDRTKPHAFEHRLEQVLRATDLLLESGGFGLIVLDLADLPPQAAHRIPLTTWFRFRRSVENKPTILLAIEQQPIAGSCSSLLLQLGPAKNQVLANDELAAKQRKNAAHGASRGIKTEESKAPKGRKTICVHENKILSPSHAYLLTGLAINVELTRSRLERKPSRSVIFETKTAWAG